VGVEEELQLLVVVYAKVVVEVVVQVHHLVDT
jgi:hypothetical protein